MDKNNIEDIYPLTPMQKGMLFHTLYAPESGVYFEQTVYALHGDLRCLQRLHGPGSGWWNGTRFCARSSYGSTATSHSRWYAGR